MDGRLVALLGVLASILLGATSALAEPPPRGARGCEQVGPFDPFNRDIWFRLGTGWEGRNARLVTTVARCQVDGVSRDYARYGLAEEGGSKLEVEIRYDSIAPYSAAAALVKREDGRWVDYRIGRGETGGALPYEQVLSLPVEENCKAGWENNYVRSPDIAVALSPAGPDGKRTAYVYNGDRPPTTIAGVGGAGVTRPIERHEDLLIARWSDPDGKVRTRIHSLGGRPLSPVLGDAMRWATTTRPYEQDKGKICYGVDGVELVILGPSLDEKPEWEGWWGPLMTPIGPDGAPMGLPPGAIGVAVVPPRVFWAAQALPERGLLPPLPLTRVWAVIYPTAEGFEFTLHEGRLAGALAASPAAERYVDLRRTHAERLAEGLHEQTFFAVQSALYAQRRDGQWRGRGYFREDILGKPGADLDAAWENYTAAAEDTLYNEYVAYQAEQAGRRAAFAAEFEAGIGSCRYGPTWSVDRALIARHAAACPQLYNSDDLRRLQSEGFAEAAVVAQNRANTAAAEQAYRVEQAELARQYVPPGAWQGALRAASDAQVRGIRESTTNWLEQRQRQYEADWQRSQRAY